MLTGCHLDTHTVLLWCLIDCLIDWWCFQLCCHYTVCVITSGAYKEYSLIKYLIKVELPFSKVGILKKYLESNRIMAKGRMDGLISITW